MEAREVGESKKRRKKCVSKAERLAKRAQKAEMEEGNVMEQIHALVQSNRSEDWDKASRLTTTKKVQVHFVVELVKKQQGKAAAHYVKRWHAAGALHDLQALLGDEELTGALRMHEATAATFLNTFAKEPLSHESLYSMLHQYVLPWITEGIDAPLQALMHNFTELKWLLLEHAMVTSQGRHLINQYAYVCQDLRQEQAALWWEIDTIDQGSQEKRENIRQAIENAIQRAWPDARVYLFGSSVTGLCSPNDDIDVCVLIPSSPVRGTDAVDLTVDIQGHLALYLSHESVVVKNARIPVVKLHDTSSELHIDLCVNNTAALWNSALIRACLDRFQPLKAICQRVRHWAKVRALVKSSHTLSSYSVVLMVLYWAQIRGYLPFFDVECHDSLSVTPADVHEAIDKAMSESGFSVQDAQSPHPPEGQLLADFFLFWACEFQYTSQIASLRRRDLLKEKSTPLLHLEDPIEKTRNLGMYLNRDSQRVLRHEIIRVCLLLRQSRQNIPRYLQIHSLAYGEKDPNEETLATSLDIVPCLLRPRSPYNFYHSMTGDLVVEERKRIPIEVVTTEEEAHSALEILHRFRVIGLDCEGAMLSRTGRICLVSIAAGYRVYLFDVYTTPALLPLLKSILEDESIVKVVHDCRKDSDALFHQAGIQLNRVFDTQVGHSVLQHQRVKNVKEGTKCIQTSESTCIGLGNAKHECIGYSDMIFLYLGIQDAEKGETKKIMNVNTWTTRPLPETLQRYAAMDVAYLPLLHRVFNAGLSEDLRQQISHRTERYLMCRQWEFPEENLSTDIVGKRMTGYINNVTPKSIYVSISPTASAAIPVVETLPERRELRELHVGDAVAIVITSREADCITGRFNI